MNINYVYKRYLKGDIIWRMHNESSFINSPELILKNQDKIKIWCIFLAWAFLNLAGSKES